MIDSFPVTELLSIIISSLLAIIVPLLMFKKESKFRTEEAFYNMSVKRIDVIYFDKKEYGNTLKKILLEMIYSNMKFSHTSLNRQFVKEYFYTKYKEKSIYKWFHIKGEVIYFNYSNYTNSITNIDKALRQMMDAYIITLSSVFAMSRGVRKLIFGPNYKVNKSKKNSKLVDKLLRYKFIDNKYKLTLINKKIDKLVLYDNQKNILTDIDGKKYDVKRLDKKEKVECCLWNSQKEESIVIINKDEYKDLIDVMNRVSMYYQDVIKCLVEEG